MKIVNFRRAAQKTEGWAAAQKGGTAGCGKGQGALQKTAALRPALFRSPAYSAAHHLASMCSPLAVL